METIQRSQPETVAVSFPDAHMLPGTVTLSKQLMQAIGDGVVNCAAAGLVSSVTHSDATSAAVVVAWMNAILLLCFRDAERYLLRSS
jgi:hypothetical protein